MQTYIYPHLLYRVSVIKIPTHKRFEKATPTINLCLICSASDCKIKDDIGPLSVCPYHIRALTMNESVIHKKVEYKDGD
jgi:hypothetical protein